MLPSVIPVCAVVTFKYWQDQVKVGMYYQNELYAQIKSYQSTERMKAYDDAYQLSEQGIHVCLTASEEGYCLWQNLKSFSSISVPTLEAELATAANS